MSYAALSSYHTPSDATALSWILLLCCSRRHHSASGTASQHVPSSRKVRERTTTAEIPNEGESRVSLRKRCYGRNYHHPPARLHGLPFHHLTNQACRSQICSVRPSSRTPLRSSQLPCAAVSYAVSDAAALHSHLPAERNHHCSSWNTIQSPMPSP
jgi:hypothetical protein